MPPRSLKGKELLVVLLDVGQHMAPYLPRVKRNIFLHIEGKILNNPTDEVAVVLFGSHETRNAVHDEYAAGGDAEAFLNIQVLHPLQCPTDPTGAPNLQLLRSVSELSPQAAGASDYVNALMVGLDMVVKTVEARELQAARKRIALISSFDYEVAELDGEVRGQLAASIQQQHIKLQVFGAGDAGPTPDPSTEQALRSANLSGLHLLLAEVAGSYTPLAMASEFAGALAFKDVKPYPLYSGPMKMGATGEVQVRVFKKTSKESLPSLKDYQEATAEGGLAGEVARVREMRAVANPDEELGPEDTVKAFRYGKQYVPITNEEQLKYEPERGFQVLGCVERDAIPRWYYVGESWVVAPKADSPADCAALSALARALTNTNKVAVGRFVQRNKSLVKLVVMEPGLATAAEHADVLYMNQLPFENDLRSLVFPAFTYRTDKPQLTPTDKQLATMDRFLRSMYLTPPPAAHSTAGNGASSSHAAAAATQASSTQADAGGVVKPCRELLNPEQTSNPVLQRFYYAVGQRAVYGREGHSISPGDTDEVVAGTVDPPLDYMAAKAAALREGLADVFPITHVQSEEKGAAAAMDLDTTAAAGGAGPSSAGANGAPVSVYDASRARTVSGVGTASPVEDMGVLLGAGQVELGLRGMEDAIHQLVADSVGDRNWGKAAACLAALRAACVEQRQGRQFNSYLEQLREGFQGAGDKGGFWVLLMKQQVAPVNEGEVPGCGMSAAAAEAYVREHSGAPAAAPAPAPAAEQEEEEDDFAGME